MLEQHFKETSCSSYLITPALTFAVFIAYAFTSAAY